MTIPTKNLDQISLSDLLQPFEVTKEKIQMYEQMRDQIEMLEREVDRQSTIIDALIKAIKVIERG